MQKGGVLRSRPPPIKYGECVLTFVPEVVEGIKYGNGGNIGVGEVEGRADYVIDLNGISRVKFPALWKLIGERSDYDHNTGLGSPMQPAHVLSTSSSSLISILQEPRLPLRPETTPPQGNTSTFSANVQETGHTTTMTTRST